MRLPAHCQSAARGLRFVAIAVLLSAVAAPAVAQKPQRSGQAAATLDTDASSRAKIPPTVTLADGLDEDEAVAVALWNNATFKADLADLGLARADLAEAGLLRNPILTLLFPLGPKQFEATLNFPFEVFFQRKRRVQAAKIDYERVARSLEQNALNLVRDARVAYVDSLEARERVRLATEDVDLQRQIVAIAEARLRAGDVAENEVLAAKTTLAASETFATHLAGDERLADERLRLLLGLGEARQPFELTLPGAEPGAPGDARDLLDLAYAARPDLRAAELGVESAAKRAKWERSKIAMLAGILDVNGSGKEGFEAGPGIQAELPIFHRNQGGKRRADAEVERAALRVLALRQQIAFDVRDAIVRMRQARDVIEATRSSLLPRATESLRLATRAYEDGETSFLNVLEAMRAVNDAKRREAAASANLRRANAHLERSIGRNRHDVP